MSEYRIATFRDGKKWKAEVAFKCGKWLTTDSRIGTIRPYQAENTWWMPTRHFRSFKKERAEAKAKKWLDQRLQEVQERNDRQVAVQLARENALPVKG